MSLRALTFADLLLIILFYPYIAGLARRGGAEVAGWTLDRKIRVWFPAYPHRVWALWWQGGKRRLWTSRCPGRGRLGTLKTPSCPWCRSPAAFQNLETGHLSRQYPCIEMPNSTRIYLEIPGKWLDICYSEIPNGDSEYWNAFRMTIRQTW